MNYVFFDIECANCYKGKGKICSFGYVIIDKDFNLLKQEDIIINPQSKFNLGPYNKEPIIQLAYTTQEFNSAKTFPYYYHYISSLLTSKDNVIFGHAVGNDLSFLQSECLRYERNMLDIKAYDTQMLYKMINQEHNDSGLEKICALLNIETPNMHRSDCDAYATMCILKALCEKQNKSITELLQDYPQAYYDLSRNGIVKHYEDCSNGRKLVNLSRRMPIVKSLATNSNINGKTFCFSKDFEENNYEEAKIYVVRLKEFGASYINRVKKAFYFVKTSEDCERLKGAKSEIEKGFDMTIITIDELKDLIKIDNNE